VDLDCHVGKHDATSVEVVCNYKFTARSGEQQAVDSTIGYLLQYEITGGESPSDGDLAEFARANGALHSWPFVREVLYGLTSRMGYPPYTLPLMHFNTKAASVKPTEPSAEAASPKTEVPTS
jgi:preprotein translocase subunit SecB